jgi:post-segregation antitoxin (ccd killing protein)
MASIRTTVTISEELAERTRQLGINVSAAARQGISDAVRAAMVEADRAAYQRNPERVDPSWTEAEAWTGDGPG